MGRTIVPFLLIFSAVGYADTVYWSSGSEWDRVTALEVKAEQGKVTCLVRDLLGDAQWWDGMTRIVRAGAPANSDVVDWTTGQTWTGVNVREITVEDAQIKALIADAKGQVGWWTGIARIRLAPPPVQESAPVASATVAPVEKADETLPLLDAVAQGKATVVIKGNNRSLEVDLLLTKSPQTGTLSLLLAPGTLLVPSSRAVRPLVVSELLGRRQQGQLIRSSRIEIGEGEGPVVYVVQTFFGGYRGTRHTPTTVFQLAPPPPAVACVLAEAHNRKLSPPATQIALWMAAESVPLAQIRGREQVSATDAEAAQVVSRVCTGKDTEVSVTLVNNTPGTLSLALSQQPPQETTVTLAAGAAHDVRVIPGTYFLLAQWREEERNLFREVLEPDVLIAGAGELVFTLPRIGNAGSEYGLDWRFVPQGSADESEMVQPTPQTQPDRLRPLRARPGRRVY